VDQQAQPSQRALALEPGDEIVRKANALERRAENELARVEDERPVVVDLDQLSQLVLGLLDVDEGIAGVVEDPEVPVDPHVDRGRLEQGFVVGIDLDPALSEEPRDRSVGEDHGSILGSGLSSLRFGVFAGKFRPVAGPTRDGAYCPVPWFSSPSIARRTTASAAGSSADADARAGWPRSVCSCWSRAESPTPLR
jgi:hypothetical protein